jgi:hypothetical protein
MLAVAGFGLLMLLMAGALPQKRADEIDDVEA